MSYNIGSDIELVHSRFNFDADDIALILMNDTFPEINVFPIILSLDPLPRGTTMLCTTVGFSLLGTRLDHPIPKLIKPMIYEFTAEFSITKCLSNDW